MISIGRQLNDAPEMMSAASFEITSALSSKSLRPSELNKDEIFANLDKLFEEIQAFEADLKQKL